MWVTEPKPTVSYELPNKIDIQLYFKYVIKQILIGNCVVHNY